MSHPTFPISHILLLLVKRVRLAKAHAYIVGHLKKEMPTMFGKDKAQTKLLNNLEEHFLKVHRAYSLPVGDFPDVHKFRGVMEAHDLAKFPKVFFSPNHPLLPYVEPHFSHI